MKACVKGIDLNSHVGFEEYCPEDGEYFGLWVTITIGPDDEEGGHLYQMLVCTPKWLRNEFLPQHGGCAWGRHMLIISHYDRELIKSEIKHYVENCTGDNFWEMAQKVARVAFWEFEDYQP